jgi:hypothetical protein
VAAVWFSLLTPSLGAMHAFDAPEPPLPVQRNAIVSTPLCNFNIAAAFCTVAALRSQKRGGHDAVGVQPVRCRTRAKPMSCPPSCDLTQARRMQSSPLVKNLPMHAGPKCLQDRDFQAVLYEALAMVVRADGGLVAGHQAVAGPSGSTPACCSSFCPTPWLSPGSTEVARERLRRLLTALEPQTAKAFAEALAEHITKHLRPRSRGLRLR